MTSCLSHPSSRRSRTHGWARRVAAAAVAIVLALLVAVAAPANAAETRPLDPRDSRLSPSQRLHALVERVRIEQSRLKTLEARFVQRQESSFLVEPEVSRGTFSYAAPDRVRWEYLSPKPISVVISGQEMTTWYHDLGRAEQIEIGRYSNQVFKYLGASGSMDSLLEYFRVVVAFPTDPAEPYRMELQPRFERIAKKLASMTLWLDAERYLPVRLRYVASDGDVTEYSFEDLKINAAIPPERFELDLPDGVELRRLKLDRGGR